MGERLREAGQNATPRRAGRAGAAGDAVAVRARRSQHLSSLAITKLDVLDGLGTAGLHRAAVWIETLEMPGDIAQLAACQPIYETLPGWSRPTKESRA
jgi:adenylosuccinate synthase